MYVQMSVGAYALIYMIFDTNIIRISSEYHQNIIRISSAKKHCIDTLYVKYTFILGQQHLATHCMCHKYRLIQCMADDCVLIVCFRVQQNGSTHKKKYCLMPRGFFAACTHRTLVDLVNAPSVDCCISQ